MNRYLFRSFAFLAFVLSVLGAPSPVHAGDNGAPQGQTDAGPPTDEALRRELEAALKSAPPAATDPGTPPAPSPGPRGSQSLNPDLSGILDANAGVERRRVSYRNGDDPVLRSTPDSAGAGLAVQEVELALSAIVDPYLKGEIYLTIPNLSGLEVEEAFATTSALPGNLQIKAGSFRSAFGRQNGQHLHIQDFTRRPLINAAFLGADGLRGPGAQVSWLTPLPFYLNVIAEAFSSSAPDVGGPVASFGGGSGTDVTYTGELKAFVPLSDDLSIYAGLSGATGVSPDPQPGQGDVTGFNRRSVLLGGDLYLKWKPPNVAGGYQSLTWQTEVIFRHLGDATDCTGPAGPAACAALSGEWDGGGYTQIVFQFARRWLLGIRGDLIGLPTSSSTGQIVRGSASLTFQASEFARLRLYGELEHAGPTPVSPAFLASALASESASASRIPTGAAAYLQLEISIGAHGAHPF
jgi:hypothetical protein